MADLLKIGVDWLTTQMTNHMSQDILIGYPGQIRHTIVAVLPACNVESIENGVRVQSQYFEFIIETELLKSRDLLPPSRGLQIEWDEKLFEIAFDKRILWDYLDPFHKNVTVKTVFKGAVC